MSVQRDLLHKANKARAKLLSRYFKTGKGQYGEGDLFIGLSVPTVRSIAKKYKEISLKEVEKLLHSPIHEFRLTALVVLVLKPLTKDIVDFYLQNTKYINNWDLVDLSAHKIVGAYLVDKPRKILYTLARSKSLWEKRIAIISTFAFLKENDCTDSVKLAKLLLHDKHDLMHKAVGWVLREVGKRDRKMLINFLVKEYKTMPRTTLRYAIERFDEKTRSRYLHGEI